MARVWDRGPLDAITSDVGALDLQSISCNTVDPFYIAQCIQGAVDDYEKGQQ